MYFFVDLVWVAMVPICVKSPGVIIKVGFIIAVTWALSRLDLIVIILWHCLTISFHFLILTASHCGHDIFDSSCVLARVSLVHGFYSIRGSQHLVFDYASGGLQNILPRPSNGGKFCFGNVLLDMDLDSVYYLPGCSCNLFWFGCGTH